MTGVAMSPALARALSDKVADGVTGGLDPLMVSLDSIGSIGSFTPAGADPKLVARYRADTRHDETVHGDRRFKFTPAGSDEARDRSVTVVVRQKDRAGAVNVRRNVVAARAGAGTTVATKITPTSYSLGRAKGLESFAIPVRKLGDNLPDLSEVGAGSKAADSRRSRFDAQVSLDAKTPVDAAPRALRASQQDYSLDVGGSYSVTRNFDVTAGIRVKAERDRMAPLTDSRQDSQAVYVGTQFRF